MRLTRRILRSLIIEQIEDSDSGYSPAEDYFVLPDGDLEPEDFPWPMGEMLMDFRDGGSFDSDIDQAFNSAVEIFQEFVDENSDVVIEDPESFLEAMKQWSEENNFPIPGEFLDTIEAQIQYLDDIERLSSEESQESFENITPSTYYNPCSPHDIKTLLGDESSPGLDQAKRSELHLAYLKTIASGIRDGNITDGLDEHPDNIELLLYVTDDMFLSGNQINVRALANADIVLDSWEDWSEDEGGMMDAHTFMGAVDDNSILIDYEAVHDGITGTLFGMDSTSFFDCVRSSVEEMQKDSASVEDPRSTLFENEYAFYEDFFLRKDGSTAIIRHIMPDSTSSIDIAYEVDQEVAGQESFSDAQLGVESLIVYDYGELVAVYDNAAVIYNSTLGLIIIDREGFRFSHVDRNSIDDDGDGMTDASDPDYDTGMLATSPPQSEYDRREARDSLRDFIEMPQEEFDSLSDEQFDNLLRLIASDRVDNDGDGLIDEMDPDGDIGL